MVLFIFLCIYVCIHTHTFFFFLLKKFKKKPPVGQVNGAFPPGFLGMQPGLHSQTESPEMGPVSLPSGHMTPGISRHAALPFVAVLVGFFLTIEMLV